MAAGAEADRGRSRSSSSSSAGLEATLDRRFQGVSNTMESIQGLSSFCIENKKHHGLVVRCWMKWLKKSDPSHRLNLFYLANDVIQNCKRKNAIVYRGAFADVLPDAALLVRDAKVRKSVERIFNIWQERTVYPEELITELKAALQKKEQPPPPTVHPKTALKSKILAEFSPHVLIESLAAYKHSMDESELREKQLAALRVDVCSSETLKRLKDKAGGNKYSKDFEEGSLKLQEFVKFLEEQMQAGPPLLEALGNAEVFYEMQYKEVKIVANAYKTFANRVSSLKRKLDALKATLPDLDDSPIPSPSEDAPSPTGSESPFHGLVGRAGQASAEREGVRTGDQKDNRDLEDMDLSEEEVEVVEEEEEEEEESKNTGIIVEDKKEKASPVAASKTGNATASKSPITTASPVSATPTKSASEPAVNQMPPSSATPTPTTPVPPSPAALQMNLANVDLGKISSILSSISNVMKSTGVSPVSRPSPGTPTPPSSQTPSKPPLAPSGGTTTSNPLASILSRVDISPEGILSALTKTQTNSPRLQGLSSLLSSARAGTLGSQNPTPTSFTPTSSTNTTATVTTTPSTPKTSKPPGNSLKRDAEQERGVDWDRVKEKDREKEKDKERDRREREREREKEKVREATTMPSLESKINSFLQGNPGFSALGLDDAVSNSPLLVGGDNADGTPVRDESGSTPTQDEIMDAPCVHGDQKRGSSRALSPTAYHSDPWDAVITPREDERKDRDYRTLSSSSSSRSQAFSPSGKNASRSTIKPKEHDNLKRKAGGSGSSTSVQDLGAKTVKLEGPGGKSVTLRRPSGGSQNGGKEKEKGKKGGKKEEESEHYHRIETVVSTTTSSNEGTPIEALGYSNRIQTVESIRVIGRGPRRVSGASGRAGGTWYEEEEFMEAPPSSHPGNHAAESPEELGLVPPPPHLVPQGQYPPPPYTNEDSTHPVHTHTIPQHHPPSSPFFPTLAPPPMSQPPPSSVAPPATAPPLPQPPPALPREFPLSPTCAVMVGGVLVPIDRVLPHPPANLRPEGAGTGNANSIRGKPLPLRPGTLKEQFLPRHAPPLHRPGAPGMPPPLLGRVREGPSSPSNPTTPTTPSPSGDLRPLLPSPNSLPSPPGSQRSRRPPSPHGLLCPPLHAPHSSPLSQRPLPRGGLPLPLPLPPPALSREPLLPGMKRHGPTFQGGLLHHSKRPFMPPRF